MKLNKEDIKKFATEDEKDFLKELKKPLEIANLKTILQAVADHELTPEKAAEIIKQIQRDKQTEVSSYCRY